MVTTFWFLVTFLVSSVLGLAAGVFSFYSDSSKFYNFLFWVSYIASYLSLFGLMFVAVACFIVYVLHAPGSIIAFIAVMIANIFGYMWIQFLLRVGYIQYRNYILKPSK